jgi:hypothetical protein
MRGDLDEADACIARLGDQRATGAAGRNSNRLRNLGTLSLMRGDLDEASRMYLKA